MNAILVVLQKELRDALRDRRALMSMLLFPLLGPLMVFFMLNTVLSTAEEAGDITLPVVGAEHAPDLIDHLQQNGITIERLDQVAGTVFSPPQFAAVETLIATRRYNYVLLVPEDFGKHIADQVTVNLELHYDSSRQADAASVARVQALLDAWGRETATLRMMARGLDPALIRPINVARVDVAGEQARAQQIVSMVSMFIVMAAFICGIGVAVDSTAGERERKSLEPLLVNPVPRHRFVIGKWLAATLFSVFGLVLTMSFSLAVLGRLPLEELGISFIMGSKEIAGMLVVVVPLAFFATALQIFVGLSARSFKDAQVYLSLLSLLPLLPAFYNMMNDTGRQFWMSFVPMLGQNMLLTDVIAGRTPAVTEFLLAAVSLALLALLLLALAAHLIKRERLLFT